MEQPGAVTLSVGHIRWAQNAAAKVFLDGAPHEARIDGIAPVMSVDALLEPLALTQPPRADLFTVVQGLINALTHTGLAVSVPLKELVICPMTRCTGRRSDETRPSPLPAAG